MTTPTIPSSASNGATKKLISRDEARASGLVRFFTGEPCNHGHISERYTKDAFCVTCKRIRRAAYTADRGPEENAKRAAYYRQHREAELARKAAYNIERRDLRGVNRNRRRASELSAKPAWFSELDDLIEREAHDLARMRESATGFAWHVDHMIPFKARTASGLHVGSNLQVIPASLNLRKKSQMILTTPGEWIARS